MTKHFIKKILFSFVLILLTGFATAQQFEPLPVVENPKESAVRLTPEQQAKLQKLNAATPVITNKDRGIAAPTVAAANVLINNNVGAATTSRFTQSETSMLAFGNTVVSSFNDAGSFQPGTNHFTGWSYSNDGGETFTDGGSLPNSAIGDAGDPVLARNNTTGRIYLSTLGFNSPSTIQMFRSDDNAVTWQAPVNATPGGTTEDKQWLTVDNFAGGGNGNVYLLSRRFAGTQGIYFFRSTDNGSTFTPNGGTLIVANSQGAFIEVGPDHSIYAFWYAGATIQMRKSTDQGATFGAAVTVAAGLVGGVNGDLALTGMRQGTATFNAFRSSEFPHAAVNPVSGHVYVTFANNPAGSDKADIFFVSSSNGGATWSAAARVNDDATTTDQWQPTIAVTPDGLNLGIFYYSRQEDPGANNLFKYYGRTASISGAVVTFGTSSPISDVASLPEFGRDAVINATYMGDYNQAVGTATGFSVIWSDNRDDLPGGAGRKDPNVYFASIPFTGAPPVSSLIFTSAALSGGNGNGVIDINECNEVNVTISNVGGAAATGISGTLTTSTPGFVITQGSSAYPDIAAGGSATNSTAFRVSTTAAFVCGTNVQLTLTANYSDGIRTFNFSLQSGIVGPLSSFSNNTSTPLPDVATTNIPITVAGFAGSVGKVTLSLHLTHTFDADLNISLISPDGTIIDLSSGNGGGGDNYGTSCAARTIFDDNAATSITAGIAPFAGTFKPEGSLAAFNGKSGVQVNGNWTLRITDAAALDFGTFFCATLALSTLECTSGATTAVTVAPATQQYSDKVTFTATLNPYDCGINSFAATMVTFKVGTQELLPAVPLINIAGVWTATAERSLLESPTQPSNGQMAPGVHTVTAVFSDLPSGFVVSNPTTSLTITCEDADVTNNGQQYFAVNPNNNTGTVVLSAYVPDRNDGADTRGDIRNARATFKDGASFATGTVLSTPNIPVGLVNPGNIQEGFVSTSFDYTLTSGDISAGGVVYQVWTGLSNYYCGITDEPTIITLGLPGNDFVTGGGHMVMQNSAGTYAGTADKKMNFGFVFKWNPSGKNLQGKANVIYRKMEGGVLYNYQIKSNAINSLVVQNVDNNGNPATGNNITFRKAIISTKANLKRLNPDGTTLDLGGGYTFTMTAWESTTVNNGSLDRISVQLAGSGSTGLLFSSNWTAGNTLAQTLNGGKIQVRNSSAPTAPSILTAPIITKLGTTENVEAKAFSIKAWPNPAEQYFTLQVTGKNAENVVIRVVDVYGKQVYATAGTANRNYRFGDRFTAGIYLVEVTQGDKHYTLKMVKK